MIKDSEKSFKIAADSYFPKWKDYSVNDLCNLYLDTDDDLKKEGLLSAIMLKYWTRLHLLYKKSYPYVTMEDCYDWLVDSVLKALSDASWRDEKSSLFEDVCGPDKAINTLIKCTRSNFFQSLNYDKRKIAMKTVSYNALETAYDSIDFLFPSDGYNFVNYFSDISREENLVIQFFKEKDYLKAFVLDIIISEGDNKPEEIAKKIKKLDVQYSKYFSDRYRISQQVVMVGIGYEKSVTKSKLETKIDIAFRDIKKTLSTLYSIEEDGTI